MVGIKQYIIGVLKKKYSGKPRLAENEFKINLGKNNFIFVCGQSDLFAEGVSDEMILRNNSKLAK